MVKRRRSNRQGFGAACAAVLLLMAMAGCGGDDGGAQSNPVAGTFVGKVRGTKAFMAVVASPAREGQARRDVTVYACDARRICEWLSGSATGNGFEVSSGDGDVEASGELSDKKVKGSIKLADRRSVRYDAGRATAAAGLYNMAVSSNGKLRGASAAGVGLTGDSTVPGPGTGRIKLADGRRLDFEVERNSANDAIPLRAGQLRLIVLSGGQLRGAGKSRSAAGEGGSNFFIRSSSG